MEDLRLLLLDKGHLTSADQESDRIRAVCTSRNQYHAVACEGLIHVIIVHVCKGKG
jgi:hypothetical protein